MLPEVDDLDSIQGDASRLKAISMMMILLTKKETQELTKLFMQSNITHSNFSKTFLPKQLCCGQTQKTISQIVGAIFQF